MKNFKKFYLLFVGLLIAIIIFNIPIIFAVGLVPDTVNPSPDYYCTWQTQLYYTNNGGPDAQRANINETTMFGAGAYQNWTNLYPNARRDLMIVMDDSWDIPLNGDSSYMGSMVLQNDRFPSYAKSGVSNQDAMKNLVTAVKNKGWKGLGGWLCAQESSQYLNGRTQQQYWTERAQWANYSGFSYWKLDWGSYADDYNFRKMLTDLSHQYAPNLTVENAKNTSNIPVSDAYRTYDVPAIMSLPCTFKRVSQMLPYTAQSGYKGIINCEDEAYIAAALGCAMSINRHSFSGNLPNGDPDPSYPSMHRNLKTKIDEITRAVRWHRIAPAFGVDQASTYVDSNYLTDTWHLEQDPNHPSEFELWWFNDYNGNGMNPDSNGIISQSGPARISRGISLPTVTPDSNGDVPFVAAAKNPNGAVSIVASARTRYRTYWTPACNITLASGNATTYGIFGHYASLTLNTSLNLANATIQVQDLAGSTVNDITSQVTRNGNLLVIPGSVINSVGMGEQTAGDTSEPGLVLVISGATAMTNLALNKTASADSQQTVNPATSGNDGNISTRWCANDGNANHWWKVDLGANCNVTGTQVIWEFAGAYKYKIEVSIDNTNWTLKSDKTNNSTSDQAMSDSFTATARYVRITATGLPSGQWASFFEFSVFGNSSGSTPTPTPTPTPNANLALNKTASADSSQSANPVQNGNDGNTTTRWCANDGNTGHWWMVDLGSSANITGTQVMWEVTGVYKYKIEVSTDNTNWTLKADKTGNTTSAQTMSDSFTATARYVRITVTGLPSTKWASFFEFSVSGSGGSSNLAGNPGFETGSLSPWTAWNNATVSSSNQRSGSYCLQLTGGICSAEQVISGLSPNTTYTLTGYAKVTSGNSVRIGVKNFGGTELNTLITSTSYTQGTVTFTTGGSNTSATIYVWQDTGTGSVYGDDISLTR